MHDVWHGVVALSSMRTRDTLFRDAMRSQTSDESLDNWYLAFNQHVCSLANTRPDCSIYLRKFLYLSRAFRPFHLKGIAVKLRYVEVTFCSIGDDNFSARLLLFS